MHEAGGSGHATLPSLLVGAIDRARRREVPAATVDEWCSTYATCPSPELRERIVAAHQWLVVVCARQLRRRQEAMDDLVQVANVGLLKALDRFDPSFGVSFHTYASATILGELRRHYRGAWVVGVPRSLQERHLAANRAFDLLVGARGHSPSTGEIAEYLGVGIGQVSEAMGIGFSSWIGELPEDDSFVGHQASAGPEDRVDDRLVAQSLLAMLEPQARSMLVWWIFDGMSQQEIGDRLGLSQVQVSRSVRRSLRQLRAALERSQTAA